MPFKIFKVDSMYALYLNNKIIVSLFYKYTVLSNSEGIAQNYSKLTSNEPSTLLVI